MEQSYQADQHKTAEDVTVELPYMGGDAEILLELRKVGLPVPKMGEKLVEFTDKDADPDTLELLLEELELAEGVRDGRA
ncbi:hypothetical protein LTR50_002814 [Elasticomyces elasticus]|nr:hypothetical protein LTR50_002814 [Elasticomyces elasticus]